MNIPVQLDMEQGSAEWHQKRRRYVSGARFHRIINGGIAGWLDVINELDNGSTFTGNRATNWGVDHEAEAIALFELLEGVQTTRCGFVLSPDNEFIGGSPDFLLGSDGGGEVKCPYNPEGHTETRLTLQVPRKYVAQVQGYMMITKRNYWWFLSYDPRETPENRLVRFVVPRDDRYIERLYSRCLEFIECWQGDKNPEKYFRKSVEADGKLPPLF